MWPGFNLQCFSTTRGAAYRHSECRVLFYGVRKLLTSICWRFIMGDRHINPVVPVPKCRAFFVSRAISKQGLLPAINMRALLDQGGLFQKKLISNLQCQYYFNLPPLAHIEFHSLLDSSSTENEFLSFRVFFFSRW
ncbi:unnamed protein product [Pylaiella littoralis]